MAHPTTDPVREQLRVSKIEHARNAGLLAAAEADGLIGEHAADASKEPCERCCIYARKPGFKFCLSCLNCMTAQSQGETGANA